MALATGAFEIDVANTKPAASGLPLVVRYDAGNLD